MIVAGLVLLVAGVATHFGLLGWFGNLPGDMRFRRGNFQLFVPVTSMIVVSLVLSLLMLLFRR